MNDNTLWYSLYTYVFINRWYKYVEGNYLLLVMYQDLGIPCLFEELPFFFIKSSTKQPYTSYSYAGM